MTIDGPAEDVEHPRQDAAADRGHQRAAGVLDDHAAGQPLGRGQGDAAHPVPIELGQDLDGDLVGRAGPQQGGDGRQGIGKADIDNGAMDRDDRAGIRMH